MFRPRHAYRTPITNRYRHKAKGCPVFNNLIEITSDLVEQHDECLECLAKLKNRSDLYRTLVENNKPSNTVIKSLQRLSASASNNRLKTCLQFLIIKVNEKSATTPKQTIIPTETDGNASPTSMQTVTHSETIMQTAPQSLKHPNRKHRSINQIKYRQGKDHLKHNQLASPPQDQVSSTQDQVVLSHDDHDCQTSPMVLTTDQYEHNSLSDNLTNGHDNFIDEDIQSLGNDDDEESIKSQTTQSSPLDSYQNAFSRPTTTTTTTTSTNTSPNQTSDNNVDGGSEMNISEIKKQDRNGASTNLGISSNNKNESTAASTKRITSYKRRRKTQNSMSSDHDTSSTASWSSVSQFGVLSPASPMSPASSVSSISSKCSSSSLSSCSSTSSSSQLSCTYLPRSPSPSPIPSPDSIPRPRTSRLTINEEKIRKIKKRPVLFDDLFYVDRPLSFVSTPTASSSGLSPGQHSNATQNSDQSSSIKSTSSICSNLVIHTFQAPATFVNNLKPCSLPSKSQEPQQTCNMSPNQPKVEMLNCAICGIKDRPPNISKIYGQNSCLLCTKFFVEFLKHPCQLFCRQDGDCLMTFDSRCQACWIKICLQKFDIDEEYRKVGFKYSPKLYSSPNVSLITIDTSAPR